MLAIVARVSMGSSVLQPERASCQKHRLNAKRAPEGPFAGRSLRNQLRALSTSAPFLIHGIMSRSFAPTSSIGCWASLARVALNEVWLTLFSSIQSRANLPGWVLWWTGLISALVSAVTMRGPVTYSPYSAVLEIE